MNRKPYETPDILTSIRQDVDAGRMTIEQAAEELNVANWLPFIDVERARHLLYEEGET